MGDSTDVTTRASLLLRLKDGKTDQAAWAEFARHYGRMIYDWCRRWGLQDADIQDVTQAVVVRVYKKIGAFEYDPERRFRGWLHTLTRHALSDFLTRRVHRPDRGTGDSSTLSVLDSTEARDDLLQRLDREFDLELLARVEELIESEVGPTAWDAYRLLAREGLSGKEAAERLGISVASAYQCRFRVHKRLCEEVSKLNRPMPSE